MERRQFLGAVAAAMAAAPALAQPKAASNSAKLKGRIKQGLWKVNFGADTKLTFDQECQIAQRLGLKGFDVIPDKDWPTLRQYGLDPLMVGPGKTDYLGGLIHPEIWDATFKGIADQGELMQKNNVHIMGLSAGQRRGMDYKTAADNCVEFCKRLGPELQKRGVTLAIENVNDRRGGDADLARQDMVFGHWDWGVEVVERVDHPAIKLLCDIYHLQIMDGDITYRLRRDIKHIAHIHVAGVPQRKLIDERQEVNFRMVAETIADLGFTGYVCHEWRLAPGEDPASAIAKAVAIMDA
jgi:hydroxypyruvate isomerase